MRLSAYLFTLFSILGSLSAHAIDPYESHKSVVVTSVFQVTPPAAGETDYRVLSTADGRVYRISNSKETALKALNLAVATSANVELRMAPGIPGLIDAVEILAASRTDAFLSLLKDSTSRGSRDDDGDFEPTVLNSKAEATDLFGSVYAYDKGHDVEDHCFDRAHYWARSFYLQDNVKSQKVFIFFTPKYQRDHDYKWWFHVAPFVLVGNSEREYVIDPTFESEVRTMKQWSLDFAEKAKSCYDGKDLGDYHSMGETEDCILLRASMYHYLPSDLNRIPSVNTWRCADLKRVMTGIAAPYRKKWDEIDGFLPANCR